jgi:hypothetical protein
MRRKGSRNEIKNYTKPDSSTYKKASGFVLFFLLVA